jgi:hypothetical protein
MSGESINSYLSVVSFGLLGFDTDEYKSRYPGIAMELLPVTTSSFDKENEPLLLCALHFLLSSLDAEGFTADIQNCWPYLDHKMKSGFKHSVYRSLESLQMRKVANFDDQLSADFWTCHLAIHGEEVWLLLRALTDICLDHAIDKLKPLNDAVLCQQNALTGPVGDAASPSTSSGDISGVNPSVPIRRKSVIQLQTEAMQGISRVGSFLVRHPPAHNNSHEASVAARTQLLLFIGEEQRKVEELITLGIAKHNRISDYMHELEERLKTAQASLAHSHKVAHSRAGVRKESVFALTDAGRQLRVTKLEKISAALILLEDLAASPLLTQTSARLAEEENSNSSSKSSSSSAGAESVNKEADAPMPVGGTVGSGASAEDSAAGRYQYRGSGERDFESRVEAGKQELLQQASLVYAIEALVNSLHDVNVVCHASAAGHSAARR